MSYAEKLRDPRWQQKRLRILDRDNWKCRICSDEEETLHVHHLIYRRGEDPWEYEDVALVTLCATCHEYETENLREAQNQVMLALAGEGIVDSDRLRLVSDVIGMGLLDLMNTGGE